MRYTDCRIDFQCFTNPCMPDSASSSAHPSQPEPHQVAQGIASMLLASLLFSMMNVCVYAASLADPTLSSTVISFIRVAVNLLLLLVPAILRRDVRELFGDLRPALWLRGLFGASALMLSFAAIQRIGAGESAFLHSSSGVFVALLSPFLLGQRNNALVWMAIVGSLLGLGLLLKPRLDQPDQVGRALALSAGWLAALAYLMVARSGRSNRPGTIVFYFCLVGVFLHLAYFAWAGATWPIGRAAWAWSIGSGLTAAGAQLYMTRSYQQAPAALLGAVGYTSPVFSLAWSRWLFGQIPDRSALLGCLLVLACGVALPFLTGTGRRAEEPGEGRRTLPE